MSNNQTSTEKAMPARDSEGFLRNLADWDEDTAKELAKAEAIDLTSAHWEVITALRLFYDAHRLAPANRALVALIKRELGAEKGQSRYLMKLFGGSPAKIAAKVAGLPKPENCL